MFCQAFNPLLHNPDFQYPWNNLFKTMFKNYFFYPFKNKSYLFRDIDLSSSNFIVNSLPKNKILHLSKFKALAGDSLNEAKLVEKEEMLITSIFSFPHNVFKGFFQDQSLKVQIVQ